MSEKQKYVKLSSGQVIIFPMSIEHDTFKHLSPVTAGFCHVRSSRRRVDCYGESYSLGGLKSNPQEDVRDATKQVFGIIAVMDIADGDQDSPQVNNPRTQAHGNELKDAYAFGIGIVRQCPTANAAHYRDRFDKWYNDKYLNTPNPEVLFCDFCGLQKEKDRDYCPCYRGTEWLTSPPNKSADEQDQKSPT